jgi:hypothetical protein
LTLNGIFCNAPGMEIKIRLGALFGLFWGWGIHIEQLPRNEHTV